MMPPPSKPTGFTIVELLIVIVVIGVLAAITAVAYNGIQDRARLAKMQSDMSAFSQAILSSRLVTQKTLMGVTLNGYTAGNCVAKLAGTDLAALPASDGCWTAYASALDKISTASGINIRGLVDPWGRPYFLDENEGESGGCSQDVIFAYAQPFNASTRFSGTLISIPLSGSSGCAL